MIYKRALRDSRVLHIAFQSLELVTACGISSNLCLRFSVYWKLASAEGAEGIQMQEFKGDRNSRTIFAMEMNKDH